MGQRAIDGEPATEDDIQQMHERSCERLLSRVPPAFSTGRSDNHRSAQGKPTPAAEALEKELVSLARAFSGLNHGVLQAVSDFDMTISEERFESEFALLEKMAAESGGHPLSLSTMQRDQAPGQWRRIIEAVEAANQRGLTMRMQVAPRGIGVMLGLGATFHPFIGFPSYKKIAHLPLAERVAQMRNREFQRQLLTEKSDSVAGDGSSIPPLADILLANIETVAMRMYHLGADPDYEQEQSASLHARAQAKGQSVLEAIYDALLEEDGNALIYFPVYNYTEGSLDNVATMLHHPLALPGLSDGGAHVGTICDASFPTFLLTHWVRDRKQDSLSVEQAIKFQSHDTARYMGLKDRGTLTKGQRADINVIDLDNLRLSPPKMIQDLPAGGRRLMQHASGYRTTLVAGTPIIEDDQLTGKKPGQLIRMGQN